MHEGASRLFDFDVNGKTHFKLSGSGFQLLLVERPYGFSILAFEHDLPHLPHHVHFILMLNQLGISHVNLHWEGSSRFFILLRPALLCYEPMDDLTPQIMAEIIRAIIRLWGDPKVLPESPRQDQLLDLLRHLGADRYLIGTVASWKDTIDDETALDDLRRLNEGKSFFDELFASTDEE